MNEEFLMITATIMALPTTLFILWFFGSLILIVIEKSSVFIFGFTHFVGWVLFAVCWAWILSH